MRHNHETGIDTVKCEVCVDLQFTLHDQILALGNGEDVPRSQYVIEFLLARIVRLENQVADLLESGADK